MVTPRRRIVRPSTEAHPTDRRHRQRLERMQTQLHRERLNLARWLRRLRRSCHALEKSQTRIARLEKQLAILEES